MSGRARRLAYGLAAQILFLASPTQADVASDASTSSSAAEPARLTPVTEFRLFAYGLVQTTKGVFLFDELSASMVMATYQAEFAASKKRMCFDYSHNIWLPNPTPVEAEACGWFDLELRSDGLWVVNIEWLAETQERLATKKYRYYSPALDFDEMGRIVCIYNIALTNIPSMYDVQPLALTQRFEEARMPGQPGQSGPQKRLSKDFRSPLVQLQMGHQQLECMLHTALVARYGDPYGEYSSYWCIEEVYDDSVIVEQGRRYTSIGYTLAGGIVTLGEAVPVNRVINYEPMGQQAMGMMTKGDSMPDVNLHTGLARLQGLLKLSKDADLDAVAEKVEAALGFQGRALALLGKDNPVEGLSRIETLTAAAERTVELETKVARYEGERFENTKATLLARAKAEGKFKAGLAEKLNTYGLMASKAGEDPVKVMTGLVDDLPVLFTTGAHVEKGSEQADDAQSEEEGTGGAPAFDPAKMDESNRAAMRKLSKEELEVAKGFGLTPARYLERKQRIADRAESR